MQSLRLTGTLHTLIKPFIRIYYNYRAKVITRKKKMQKISTCTKLWVGVLFFVGHIFKRDFARLATGIQGHRQNIHLIILQRACQKETRLNENFK